MLKLEYQNIKCGILDRLEGHFYHLSLDKFGSNVVEECLRQAPRVGRLEGIILELLGTPKSSSLFLNNYGNYVMQTALQVSQVRSLEPCLDKRITNLRVSSETNVFLESIHCRILGRQSIKPCCSTCR